LILRAKFRAGAKVRRTSQGLEGNEMRKGWIALAALAAASCSWMPSASAPKKAPETDMAAFTQPPMSPAAILDNVKVLSSDAFEGRAPSTHGEQLTIDFVSRAFAKAGLQPAVPGADGKNGWFQEVPLVSSKVENSPSLAVSGKDGKRDYEWS